MPGLIGLSGISSCLDDKATLEIHSWNGNHRIISAPLTAETECALSVGLASHQWDAPQMALAWNGLVWACVHSLQRLRKGTSKIPLKCVFLGSQFWKHLKSRSNEKCVLLIATSLGCLTFTVQNDLCAEFDDRRLFSHLCVEEGKFNTCTHERDFVTSQLVCDVETWSFLHVEFFCGITVWNTYYHRYSKQNIFYTS